MPKASVLAPPRAGLELGRKGEGSQTKILLGMTSYLYRSGARDCDFELNEKIRNQCLDDHILKLDGLREDDFRGFCNLQL